MERNLTLIAKLCPGFVTQEPEGSRCSSVGTSSSSDCATNSETQQTENPDTSEIFSMNDWDNWLT